MDTQTAQAGRQVYMMVEQSTLANIEKQLSEIKELMTKGSIGNVEQHMSQKEAANFLKISISSFTPWVKSDKFPKDLIHWVGKRRVFYKSELAKAKADGRLKKSEFI